MVDGGGGRGASCLDVEITSLQKVFAASGVNNCTAEQEYQNITVPRHHWSFSGINEKKRL